MSVFLSLLCCFPRLCCTLCSLSLPLITYVSLDIHSGQLLPQLLSLLALSLAVLLQLEAPGAATLAITPQEREHKHTPHTQRLQAPVTGCLIASQELIIKLEKSWHHQSVCVCVQ